jgi:hypothetical protein
MPGPSYASSDARQPCCRAFFRWARYEGIRILRYPDIPIPETPIPNIQMSDTPIGGSPIDPLLR